MARPELGCDIVKITHRVNINPGLRHCNHHIRFAKSKFGQKLHLIIRIGHGLASQVLAGGSGMDCAVSQISRMNMSERYAESI